MAAHGVVVEHCADVVAVETTLASAAVAAVSAVWSEVSDNGQGWSMGLAQAVVIAIPGVLLLRAHQSARRGPATD